MFQVIEIFTQKALSIFSAFVLYLMGWTPLTNQTLKLLKAHKKSVVVFSHTSYADFYIWILYRLWYYEYLNTTKTLIKPQPFRYASWLLRSLGGIPATKVSDKNGGAVTRIVEELSHYDSFVFLLSPKGTIEKAEWRSGYYNIANLLQVPIFAAGVDYEKKCIVATSSIDSNHPEPYVREFLQKQLSDIVPLFPECEIVDIREHDFSKRNIVTPDRLLFIFSASLIVLTNLLQF